MALSLRNYKRATKKLVFKRYDLILHATKKALDLYSLKRLPVSTFKEFAARSEFSKEEVEDIKNLGNFCEHFNKTIYLIKDFAEQNGKHFGDNCVSLNEVKQWIEAAKTGFIKGQNGEE